MSFRPTAVAFLSRLGISNVKKPNGFKYRVKDVKLYVINGKYLKIAIKQSTGIG